MTILLYGAIFIWVQAAFILQLHVCNCMFVANKGRNSGYIHVDFDIRVDFDIHVYHRVQLWEVLL